MRLRLILSIIAALMLSGCSRQTAALEVNDTELPALTASAASVVPATPPVSPDTYTPVPPSDDTSPQNVSYLRYSLAEGEGWRMEVAGQGMFSADNNLYKTNDDGATWQIIADTASGILPSEAVSGMLFTSVSDGWITVDSPRGGYSGLFRTDNGGAGWSLVQLEGTPDSLYSVELPVFFSGTTYGLLLAKEIAGEEAVFWVTCDEGDSWTAVADKPSGVWKEMNWTFTREEGKTLWEIRIGGKSWTYDGVQWSG